MVVLSAAFAIIIPFAALSLIIQLLGDPILLTGVVLLLLGPIIVVMNSSRFTATTVFTSSEKVVTGQRILLCAALLRIAGLITIFIWAILYSEDGFVLVSKHVDGEYIEGLISYAGLAEKSVEFLGGVMFQAVLWTDIIVHVSRNDDVKMKKLDSDLRQ